MPPMILIQMKETGPIEGLAKQENNRILREAHEEIGHWWAEEILETHFDADAAARYGHQARNPQTVRRKIKAAAAGLAIFGGRVDLVWTGFMMRAVLGHQRVRATPTGVTINIFGPTYLYKYDKRKNQPDKASELTAVTDQEKATAADKLDHAYAAGIKEFREVKTTTFGG